MLRRGNQQFRYFIRAVEISHPYSSKLSCRNFCVAGGGASDYDDHPISKSPKPRARVGTLLIGKEQEPFIISKSTIIRDAISKLGVGILSATLVMDDNDTVAGIVTARDILRYIDEFHHENPTKKLDDCLKSKISEVMTPKEKMAYCGPNDTVSRCREIMFQNNIRHLPVIHDGVVLGIIGIKDIADSILGISVTGGKKGFISNVIGHKGLPSGTKVHANKSHLLSPPQLALRGGVFALPHPFKRANSVAHDRRQYGATDLSTDLSLCEDANFLLSLPNVQPNKPNQVYACVADGVGSWRQYGIDPKLFSQRIVENAKRVIETESTSQLETISTFGRDAGVEVEILHPYDIMMEAWQITTAEQIEGSSTFCIATIDYNLNQLLYSNVGDCGLMVLRHIDSETAGYLRDRHLPRHLRQNDLRIAYLSQQQLRSFNLPYQLGYIDPGRDYSGTFESPADADTASIPVLPGDIIILATDGLYDNIDLKDIISLVETWEKKWFPVSSVYPVKGDAIKYSRVTSKPEVDGDEAVCQELAQTLTLKAREYSLDSSKDSPFALLAKENDIMWGGGMPDDTTVIVMRVVNSNYQPPPSSTTTTTTTTLPST